VPLPELQRAILARVAPLVRPGGVLVYAVCTVSRDEGPGAVAWLRERMPEWEPAEASEGVPERLRPAEVVLRPDTDGTDGFMVFRLRRKTSA
jgi:16S rRNA (cytosine967-C5)-methyltransferase